MAIDDCETIVYQRTVIESSRLINLHVIEGRVYYVFTHSLCVSDYVITRFESQIIASCICGPTIALILRSGKLVVLHPDTLLYADVKKMCIETIGMPSFKLSRRRVAATPSGSFIAVNLTNTSIQIYGFNGNSLSFCRTINVPGRGIFQLTGDTIPYLWHMYTNGKTYLIDLLEANEDSTMNFPDFPVARCPIVLEGRAPKSFEDSKCRLYACQMASMEGVFCLIEGTLYYLGLKSAVIGDLSSGLTKYPSKWFGSICTSYSCSETQIYLCSRSDSRIYKIEAIDSGGRQVPTVAEQVGKVPQHLRSERNLHFAVVPMRDRDHHRGKNGRDSGIDRSNVEIICEPYSSGIVRDFSLDLRKSPRKVLLLGVLSLNLRAGVTPVKSLGKKQGGRHALDVIYIGKLKMLLVTSTLNNKVMVLTRKYEDTSKTSGLTMSDDSCFEFADLVAAGVVKNHTLALVSSQSIRLHSAVAPLKLLGSANILENSIILEACCTDLGVVTRAVDNVALVYVERDTTPLKLIDSIPTSFIAYSGKTLHVGLDISFFKSRELFESLVRSSGVKVQLVFLKDSSCKLGAIATFKFGGKEPQLISLSVHPYVPTGFYRSAKSHMDFVFHGFNGKVGCLIQEKQEVTYTTLGHNFEWIGVQDDAVLILSKVGIIIVSALGCQLIFDSSRHSQGNQITSVAIINKQAIAFVSKQELKLTTTPKIKGPKPTALLKKMQLPRVPHNMKLKLLPVPSQRLFLFHGENICMFYDSSTFAPLLVTGMNAVWCESILLWKFEFEGEWYEHLVFVDDSGWVESYSFRREGMTLECSCKYRAAVFNDIMRQKSIGVLHCSSSALYVSRGEHLVVILPGTNTVKQSKKLRNEVKCLSHTRDYLFVSTARELLALTIDSLAIVAKISIQSLAPMDPRNSLCSLKDPRIRTQNTDMFGSSVENRFFVSHVACTIRQNDEHDVVYILCGYSAPKEERQHLSLVQFDPLDIAFQSHGVNIAERSGPSFEAVFKLRPDPESDPEESHSTMRVYTVTCDHEISLIDIAPKRQAKLYRDTMF